MDTLVIFIAFVLILAGVSGALFLPRNEEQANSRRTESKARAQRKLDIRRFHDAFSASRRTESQPQHPVERTTTPRAVVTETRQPEPVSEVDLLRAEVEHLRSELVALTGSGVRPDRPRLRRQGFATYTYLPRVLRRQVREVRTIRRPSQMYS